MIADPRLLAGTKQLARLLCCLLSLTGGLVSLPPAALAQTPTLWEEEQQRFRVGLKIFPACLGAVESLEDRLTSDGSLQVLVVYEGSDAAARQAVTSLNGIGRVRGLTLNAKALSVTALDEDREAEVSAIFVASVGLGSRHLRAWSERYQVLVFSPFDGEVEAGAVAGLYVADRILPYINLTQAQRARIRFKPFFLQVARQHD
ncbi:YfiR/HmsC family protein [Thiobaca trueperi]|uniref:YfiR/HmsC family protein n=1 Tax=Thiobaca trueperi TaxID=127458 RepID=UPI001FB2975C|nr:YfiR/HmsC family protein [Thiobaca trueperi]